MLKERRHTTINVLLITDIAGARISTEASWQLMFGYLWTWQWSKYLQKHRDNYHWIIYKHCGRMNINDCQVWDTLFFEATPEIYLIFNYYVINKLGNSYYLRLFDFTVEDIMVLMFDLNCDGRPFHDWVDYVWDLFS